MSQRADKGKTSSESVDALPPRAEEQNGATDVRHTDEKERAAIEHALRERVKELNCLYEIAQLSERQRNSLSRILQGVVNLIPPAWQYPEYTCARIIYGESHYHTAGFRETRYRQSADILVSGRKVGAVEVYYTKKMPKSDEGPFLKEERSLLDVIAERLGRTVEKFIAEEEARSAHAQLELERRALQEANAALRTVLSRIEDEKHTIKEAIVANVDKILMPILHALEAEVAPEKKGYIRLLRRNLEEIASPLVDRLARRFMSLSPSELRICNMIRMGLSTKEIAGLRHISPATVNRQRESIRRKLGLTGKSVNLVTYMQTFDTSATRTLQGGRLGLEVPAESTATSRTPPHGDIGREPVR